MLEASDGPLMYQLKHLGAAECHFAYRMVVVMMRRDMPMPKVTDPTGTRRCNCLLASQRMPSLASILLRGRTPGAVSDKAAVLLVHDAGAAAVGGAVGVLLAAAQVL